MCAVARGETIGLRCVSTEDEGRVCARVSMGTTSHPSAVASSKLYSNSIMRSGFEMSTTRT